MKPPKGPEVITLSIPSRLELLPVLDKLLSGIIDQVGFDEADADAVAISIIEAGTNAIQHGHKKDPSKIVYFRFDIFPDRLGVDVTDSGAGFDLSRVLASDPTTPEGLLQCCGRGIFIMRQLMDTVDFDIRAAQGTTVHLEKMKRTNGR
jgi:serine/threonine-protein kinase RsbW